MKYAASTLVVAWIVGLFMSLAAPSDSAAASTNRYIKLMQGPQPLRIAQISEEDVPATRAPGSETGGDTSPNDGSQAAEAPGALGD